MADMQPAEERRTLDTLVCYFAGATFMAFLQQSTSMPLRVTDARADPPDGFYVTLATGECLRISVARVRTPPPTAL